MTVPGNLMPGGIVLIDEPEFAGVTTFAANGEVLLTFNARPGGNIGQVMIGLTPAQALQLIQRLQMHANHCRLALAEGNGGARWPDEAP